VGKKPKEQREMVDKRKNMEKEPVRSILGQMNCTDLDESGSTSSTYATRDLRNPRENSVRIAGVSPNFTCSTTPRVKSVPLGQLIQYSEHVTVSIQPFSKHSEHDPINAPQFLHTPYRVVSHKTADRSQSLVSRVLRRATCGHHRNSCTPAVPPRAHTPARSQFSTACSSERSPVRILPSRFRCNAV
jgi:hypothetical protein